MDVAIQLFWVGVIASAMVPHIVLLARLRRLGARKLGVGRGPLRAAFWCGMPVVAAWCVLILLLALQAMSPMVPINRTWEMRIGTFLYCGAAVLCVAAVVVASMTPILLWDLRQRPGEYFAVKGMYLSVIINAFVASCVFRNTLQ
jgi:hypothetical protein